MTLNKVFEPVGPAEDLVDDEPHRRCALQSQAHAPFRDPSKLLQALLLTGKKDKRAFHDVYLMTSGRLFAICLRICGERSLAEHALKETYLSIWQSAGTWDSKGSSPMTWFCIIARNHAIDWRRTQGQRRTMSLESSFDPIELDADPEADASVSPEHRRLPISLVSLSDGQCHAIRDAIFAGYTYHEIARKTGIPLGTITSWIRRGLAKQNIRLEKIEST